MMERILNVSQTFASKNATTMFGNFQLVNSSLTGNYSVLHGDLQTKPPLPSFLDSSNYDYNYYLEDLSSLRVPWVEDRAFLPTTITYSVAFIAGVLGNGLVVVSLMMDKKWQTATSSFLVSLGIADLVFLLICVPYELMMRLSSAWSGGMALCKIAGFVEMMTASASVLNLAAVSVERYAVIVHPIKSRTWCSRTRMKKIVAAVWLFSIILSSPMLYIMDTTEGVYYNTDDHVIIVTCADSNVSSIFRIVFAWYQLVVMFILPVAMMVFCYSFVIFVLWSSTREMTRLFHSESDGDSSTGSRRRSKEGSTQFHDNDFRTSKGNFRLHRNSSVADRKYSDIKETRKQVIKMLMTIIVVFFCCWGPKWVLNVMKRHYYMSDLLHNDSAFYAMLTIHLLPFLQSSVNPIIYGFMSSSFRRSVRAAISHITRKIIGGCCGEKRKSASSSKGQEAAIDMNLINRRIFTGSLPNRSDKRPVNKTDSYYVSHTSFSQY